MQLLCKFQCKCKTMHTLTPILDLDTTNSMLQCFGLMLILSEHCMYRVSQKNVVSWKNSHNNPQLIQNANVEGVLENSGYLLPDGH